MPGRGGMIGGMEPNESFRKALKTFQNLQRTCPDVTVDAILEVEEAKGVHVNQGTWGTLSLGKDALHLLLACYERCAESYGAPASSPEKEDEERRLVIAIEEMLRIKSPDWNFASFKDGTTSVNVRDNTTGGNSWAIRAGSKRKALRALLLQVAYEVVIPLMRYGRSVHKDVL